MPKWTKKRIWGEVKSSAALIAIGAGVWVDWQFMFGGDPDTSSFSAKTSQAAYADTGHWYAGGTLHRANGRDWIRASVRDKLATCADFVATQRTNVRRMDDLREDAENMMLCIDLRIFYRE